MKIGTRQQEAGFTLVEIMIVIAIIGLLAAVTVPNMVKARAKSQRTVCIKNLRMIDGAKETWALEAKRAPADTVIDSEVNVYIKGGAPVCPASGTYNYNTLALAPTCTVEGHVLPEESTVTNPTATPPASGSPSALGDSTSGSGNSGPGGGDR